MINILTQEFITQLIYLLKKIKISPKLNNLKL